MADSDRPPSFTVNDRRAFDASGERKETASSSQAAPKTGQPGQAIPVAPPRPEGEPALPPADFATLVLSLGSSAIAYLGEVPAPGEEASERNLPMAKHAIDLLSVLQEKTRGNLSAEEGQVLESLLFDLRLRYVEAVKPSAP